MLAILLALSAATSDPLPPPALSEEPDSVALEGALKAFSTAFVRADAGVLDTFLVADYLHTNGGTGAVLNKAQWLDYVRSRRSDLQSGRLSVERYETVGLVIRWYPSAAVVSSQVLAEGREDGIPFASRLQVTQVWIRVGEGWRRAAFHDSRTPGP